jgi:hypothetical protein
MSPAEKTAAEVFQHPENIITADKALTIVDFCLSENPSPRYALAEALCNAWHDGARFGTNEAVTMSTKMIDRALELFQEAITRK